MDILENVTMALYVSVWIIHNILLNFISKKNLQTLVEWKKLGRKSNSSLVKRDNIFDIFRPVSVGVMKYKSTHSAICGKRSKSVSLKPGSWLFSTSMAVSCYVVGTGMLTKPMAS